MSNNCSTKQEQNDNKIYLLFKTRGERRVTKGDKRRRPSKTILKKRAEVRRLTSFERLSQFSRLSDNSRKQAMKLIRVWQNEGLMNRRQFIGACKLCD